MREDKRQIELLLQERIQRLEARELEKPPPRRRAKEALS